MAIITNGVFHFVFMAITVLFASQRVNSLKSNEVSSVLDNILAGYDRRIRPDFSGPPVDVGITMYILGISSVSEETMDYTMDFYFRQFWKDERLAFGPRHGLANIPLDSKVGSTIWMPDTFFPNSKNTYHHQDTVPNTFSRISPYGEVLRSIRLSVTASCPMNLKYFPMDTQTCTLDIESYSATANDIRYKWKFVDNSVGISSDLELPQFQVNGYRLYTTDVALSTGNYSRLSLEILLVRNTSYYLIQIYFPAFIIVVVSWVGLWFNRNKLLPRVIVGITTVLTIVTLMSSVSSALPKTSYMKAIDIYLIFCFIMVFASLVEHVVIDYIGRRIFMVQNIGSTYQKNCEDGGALIQTTPNKDSNIGLNGLNTFYNDRLKNIDKYARILFPIVFICFNILYWIITSSLSNVSISNYNSA